MQFPTPSLPVRPAPCGVGTKALILFQRVRSRIRKIAVSDLVGPDGCGPRNFVEVGNA